MARKASACWAGGIRDAGPFAFIRLFPNLEPAFSLALDDDFAVLGAEFDLTNVTASNIGLFSDQVSALQAAADLALRDVFAAPDANRCGRGIEVRLGHQPRLRFERFWLQLKRTVYGTHHF